VSAPAVIAEGLTRTFGSFTAVDGLNLTIAKGQIVGFIGPNGAGKSTTIRMLCGLLKPSGGRAVVAGYDVAREPEAVRAHIGYMSQKFSLYELLTVRENLRFFAGLYLVPRREMEERIRTAVAMAGLEGREDDLVRTLAGGWKQRLALGCAILHRPPVLFLDEPTSGVEPEARRRFWELIHHLASDGVTILVSTHYMEEAEYCNRIELINAGKLVASGSPGELRHRNIGGVLYELECAAAGSALVALQAAPGVIDAAIFGDKLHVLARDADAASGMRGFLLQRGIVCGDPRGIEPSLEDVFVQLVTRPGETGLAA
jgi:ABC-2 type transport system ATP-binding protein